MSQDTQLRRFSYLDTEAGQVHYWTAGAGPNLLLLHQSGNSSEEFAATVPYLAPHFRLVAVDFPGHGRTYDPTSQLSVEDFAATIRSVLDELEIRKTHIVGHHGGSLSAMSLMAAEPDRFDRAILSGVDEELSPEEKQAFIKRIKSTDTNVRAESDFVADTWTRYQKMLSDGADPAMALKPFIAFLDARLRPYRGILTNLAWDRKEAIAKLRGPVLILTGENDSYVVKQTQLLSMILNSEHMEVPGAGTFMFYDDAKKCADIVLNYLQA